MNKYNYKYKVFGLITRYVWLSVVCTTKYGYRFMV